MFKAFTLRMISTAVAFCLSSVPADAGWRDTRSRSTSRDDSTGTSPSRNSWSDEISEFGRFIARRLSSQLGDGQPDHPHASVLLSLISDEDRKAASLYVKHFQVYFEGFEKEDMIDGVALFMEERQRAMHGDGRKIFSNEELDGLFHAESLKGVRANQKAVTANELRKDERDFYTHFLKQKSKALDPKVMAAASAGGSTNSCKRITLSDKHVCYYKRLPDDKSDPLSSPRIGKKMAAELAASELNDLLGWDLVPRTSLMNYEQKLGTVQESVPTQFTQLSVLNSQEVGSKGNVLNKPELEDARSEFEVFNFLGSIRDRHHQNIFVDEVNRKIMSIDNDSGFHFVLPPKGGGCPMFHRLGKLPEKYTQRTKTKLMALEYSEVKDKFKGILPLDQINALWLRLDILRADIYRRNSRGEGSEAQASFPCTEGQTEESHVQTQAC